VVRHIVFPDACDKVSDVFKIFNVPFGSQLQETVVVGLFLFLFVDELLDGRLGVVHVLDCAENQFKVFFFSAGKVVDFLEIHFLDQFDFLDSGNLLVEIRVDFLVGALLVFHIKVGLERFEDLDRVALFVLEVTKQSCFFLIFLFVLVRGSLEVGQEGCELLFALVEANVHLLLELLFFLFLLRIVLHLRGFIQAKIIKLPLFYFPLFIIELLKRINKHTIKNIF
jgi:hypothetical protein